jgi:hypothetical protein
VETDENREHTPSPQSDSIPLLNFKPLGPLSNSGRTGTRTGTFTRRSRKNIHILRCHHFTLLPTSTLSPCIPQLPSTSSCINTACKDKTCDPLLKFLVLCRGVREGKQKTKSKQKKKTKNFESPDAREELRTLILTWWVSFLFLQNSKTVCSFLCNLNLLH